MATPTDQPNDQPTTPPDPADGDASQPNAPADASGAEGSSPPDPSDDAGSIDQGDIDALFGETPAPVPAEAPATAGDAEEGVDQASIDAMFEDGDKVTADAAAGDSVKEISQADIDALMSATGAEGDEAATEKPAVVNAGDGAAAAPPVDERLDTLGRPFDEAAAAMQAAIEEEQREQAAAAAAAPPTPPAPAAPRLAGPPPPVEPFNLTELCIPEGMDVDPKRVSMLHDVNLRVRIELGRTRMLVEDVLKLDEGSVVELDKLAGDPVDVFVNDRLIARGEVLVLNDNFCVRISEVLSHDPHRVSA